MGGSTDTGLPVGREGRCWGQEENQSRARKSSKTHWWATAERDRTITKMVKAKEKAASFDGRQ